MKIKVTAGEVLDKGDWDTFCDLKGLSVYAINEGLMSSDETFELTLQEAKEVGMSLCIEDGDDNFLEG